MREKLGLHCDVISGYAFSTSDWKEEGIPVVKIGNISNGEDILCNEQMQYVEESFLDKLDEKYHISKGDVLISLTGSHINQPNSMVGRTCRSLTDKRYLLNQRAGKVLPFENTNKNYLYYLLSTKAVKYDIANRAYGGANQVNVSPKDIKKIKWDFPTIDIQEKISKILSTYDELIENNNKRIKLLEQMAEKLYKEWFVRFRFPGYETITLEEKRPFGWIVSTCENPKIPSCFEYCEFSEIGSFVRGRNITVAEMVDGEIPVISAGLQPSGYHNQANVKGRSLTISASGANAGYLQYNLTNIWAADCSYYQNDNNLWFIYCTLKFLQPVINNLQCGAAQPHVYPKNINKLCVLKPTEELIIKFNETVEPFFKEIEILKKKNDSLVKQRDLLLPRLMSGKLEV